ncbi:dual specificity phosphatase [Angomonas deanei]|uniref:Dual specificity phosphatase, catalytic domain containing protein, putative n=1 Tax=Angomonas deanei TaxID=59799 RepID=S9W5W7_9TRYP|nr:dual specificity phosphatase [Angomonas deanei]EPY41002.1 dual specificity phosphatase [Angomonas deanei]CAD2217151.1 Dual specificity phosphatase, catalytic domain containing protein, putative [Angomonas deanei]|eukprot:EPY31320.1 dual specificity phosphatase [Angomonas deanei]
MESLSEKPFTREEERRYNELLTRLEETHELPPEEELEFAQLKHRNNMFILEGERRLLEGAAARKNQIATGEETGGVRDSIVKAGKAAYFWGTLLATAVPGYLGQRSGVTPGFLHWNFIYDYLMLGALPVVTQVGSSGNHLTLIKDQAAERNPPRTVGMVCACLEMDEIKGYGMEMIQFADKASWQKYVNPDIEYAHLPMVDTTANVPFHLVAEAVAKMNVVINERQQAVYVHCKAGKGRSWMVTMCYLTTFAGLSYEDASRLIKVRRGQVSPSSSQVRFAKSFLMNFIKWKSIKEYNEAQAAAFEPEIDNTIPVETEEMQESAPVEEPTNNSAAPSGDVNVN